MTTVQYGGGPTLEQRRKFANLRPGSHIPGYCGYNPQLKYVSGKTYGEHTADLAQLYPHKHTIEITGDGTSVLNSREMGEPIRLPQATGDNKFVEGMIPGYTGYVPTLFQRFGGTYRNNCDQSVADLVRSYDYKSSKEEDLRRSAAAFPQLRPLAGDPAIRDHMDFWGDRKPRAENKRMNPEPPIPGYKGYVPRIYTTPAGLGCRYHEMTKNGLETFAMESSEGSGRAATARPTYGRNSLGFEGNRIFKQEGMKPAYTGYVPRRRYAFGNTYGDTTRNLPVCTHSYPSYGTYVQTLQAN